MDRNIEELNRLRKIYPLFDIDMEKDGHAVAHLSHGSMQYFVIENGRIDREISQSLDKDHMEKSISQELMKLYPDLHIGTYANKDGISVSVWISRDNRDAESVGEISVTSPELHETLKNWQKEAHQAKQNGWFFCTGHEKAELRTKGCYFHFAGNYCEQWGNEHPDSRKAAANQNYD
jgi:hypothetical protein